MVGRQAGRPSHLICIGAQKAGTSWLYPNLAQHASFCAPARKELNYFYKNERVAYEDHFRGRQPFQVRVDVSPNYSVFGRVAQKIHDQCPNPRILYILRDPVERTVSQYRMAVQLENIRGDITFRKAFWEDRQRIRTRDLYSRIIAEYMQYFRRTISFKGLA